MSRVRRRREAARRVEGKGGSAFVCDGVGGGRAKVCHLARFVGAMVDDRVHISPPFKLALPVGEGGERRELCVGRAVEERVT